MRKYDSKIFGAMRVENIDNEPWFCTVDICREIGLKKASIYVRRYVGASHIQKVQEGFHEVLMVDAFGAAHLIEMGYLSDEDKAMAQEEIERIWLQACKDFAAEQEKQGPETEQKCCECNKIDANAKINYEEAEQMQGIKEMENIKIFENIEFGEIRGAIIDGEPWFIGRDVATALGYGDGKSIPNAIAKHVDDMDKGVTETMTPGGKQKIIIINESGLYALIFGSKLESAKRFKHWVTSEVLPTIRKTGSYQQEQPRKLTPLEMMRLQLGMIDEHESRIKTLEDTMTIDYGQQKSLETAVNASVINALGGKDSNAYKEIGKKVFAECNHDLKTYFKVNARNNVPRKRYDEAIEYASNWKPCTNTAMKIRTANAQETLFLE